MDGSRHPTHIWCVQCLLQPCRDDRASASHVSQSQTDGLTGVELPRLGQEKEDFFSPQFWMLNQFRVRISLSLFVLPLAVYWLNTFQMEARSFSFPSAGATRVVCESYPSTGVGQSGAYATAFGRAFCRGSFC